MSETPVSFVAATRRPLRASPRTRFSSGVRSSQGIHDLSAAVLNEVISGEQLRLHLNIVDRGVSGRRSIGDVEPCSFGILDAPIQDPDFVVSQILEDPVRVGGRSRASSAGQAFAVDDD